MMEEMCIRDRKIEEEYDGTIIIGGPNFGGFPQRGTYNFYRNKDIFSRSITRDDQESYRQVCVHDSEYKVQVYKDVESYEGWNLQSCLLYTSRCV